MCLWSVSSLSLSGYGCLHTGCLPHPAARYFPHDPWHISIQCEAPQWCERWLTDSPQYAPVTSSLFAYHKPVREIGVMWTPTERYRTGASHCKNIIPYNIWVLSGVIWNQWTRVWCRRMQTYWLLRKPWLGEHEIKLEVEGPFVHQSGTIHTLSVFVFVWEGSISLTICRRPI